MDLSLTTLQSHAAGLLSAGGLAAVANILLIDLIMSGDRVRMKWRRNNAARSGPCGPV
jgi:hypothetical protein